MRTCLLGFQVRYDVTAVMSSAYISWGISMPDTNYPTNIL